MQYHSTAQNEVRHMSRSAKAAMMQERLNAASAARQEQARRWRAIYAERNTPEYRDRRAAAARHGVFSPEWEAFVAGEMAADVAVYAN